MPEQAVMPAVSLGGADAAPAPARRGAGPGLAIGFGAAVAMWASAYLARLPFVQAPAAALFVAFVGCYLGAGFLAARSTGSVAAGARAGAVASCVNLLVLLGLLWKENAATAAAWIPASIGIGAALSALGALAGRRAPAKGDDGDWTGALCRVHVVATVLLVAVGGLVTSHDAGLAVPDWPNTFGSNMFLYPLARMTGGIYYEHAHRLFGTLIGLTTIVAGISVFRADTRPGVRPLALGLIGLVIVQGVLGGLRVTDLSIALAIAHGMLGQVFLALVGAQAALMSRTWRHGPEASPHEAAETDRSLTAWTVGLVLVQLLLGALTRHLSERDGLVTLHITMAVVVVVVSLFAGLRAWGIHPDLPPLRRAGLGIAHALGLQLVLGVTALVARELKPGWEPLVTTAHQTTGALILLLAVQLFAWQRRLTREIPLAVVGAER